jgi:hypothetical protein
MTVFPSTTLRELLGEIKNKSKSSYLEIFVKDLICFNRFFGNGKTSELQKRSQIPIALSHKTKESQIRNFLLNRV